MDVIPPDEQLGRKTEQTLRHAEHLIPVLVSKPTEEDHDEALIESGLTYQTHRVHLYSRSWSCTLIDDREKPGSARACVCVCVCYWI